MTTLASVIRGHAAARPDAVALTCGPETLTYRDLDRRSNRVARALEATGVGPEGRIAFFDKNSVDYFELLFGAAKLNAVVVPVNWRLAAREVAFIVHDSEASVFVFGAEYADLVAGIAAELPRVKQFLVAGQDGRFESYAAWRERGGETDPGVEAVGSDIAFHIYSSGTTGHPKGVLLSNDNLLALMPNAGPHWGFSPEAITMVAMPLFHIGGCGWAMVGLYFGCKLVVVREINPALLIQLIGEHRITHAFVVPALLQFMQMVPSAATADFSSLKLIVYGASPISESVLAGAVRLMKCGFAQAYGLTESTGAIVTLPPEDHDPDGPNRHRLRAAGKPHEGVEMKIVSSSTGAEVPQGEPGEIWARSPQVMVGYWRRQDGYETVTADGWLRTGDIGYFDQDGYLYIHDRLKDMIISGGENVYPAEVENVLIQHETVADVAVIGIPSEKWGESPLAVVVPARGAMVNEMDLLTFARKHLAGFKVPVAVEIRGELPRNPSGKILKRELREPYWKDRDRQVS